ncbi:MAG: hypothetical protein RQ885_03105 [Desulfurococcales archaeon]|jgi:4-amino-4-deoxy-L-arabinose transferase-like glycosyltransferase|nr:hypothetical protein [Desulfurococcales archaeon]
MLALKKIGERIVILIIIFSIVGVIYILSINVIWFTSYTAPLIDLSSKICRGEVFLEEHYSVYVDVVKYNSNYLFAGPIGLPLVISIPLCFFGISGNQLLIGGVVVSLYGLASTVVIYLFTRLYGDRYVLASTLVISLSGLLWIYSSHIFPQAPLTFSMLLALYLSVSIVRRGGDELKYLLLGFLSSLTLLMDPMAFLAPLSLGIIVAIYVAKYHGLRSLLCAFIAWTAGFSPLAAAQALYNVATTGNPFSFPETLLLVRIGVDGYLGLSVNPLYGLYMLIIDPRKGLIPLYPVLGLGASMLPRFIASIPDIYERLLLVIFLASYTIPHAMWYDFDGGLSYGPRFLTPITPILAPSLQLLLTRRPRLEPLVMVLSALSILTNSVVVTVSPYTCALEEMEFPSNQFLSCVLPKLVEGVRSSYLYEALKGVLGDVIGFVSAILALGIASIILTAYTLIKKI